MYPLAELDPLSALSQLGVAGGSCAVAWYLLKFTVPRLMDAVDRLSATFAAEAREQRESHAAQVDASQKAFAAELAKERELSEKRAADWRHTLVNIMHGRGLAAKADADAGPPKGE